MRPLSRLALLPLLVGFVVLCACSGSDVPLPQPSPPAGAAVYREGPLSTASDLAMADLHSRLRKHYDKPWDIQRHGLPPQVGWESVTAHYERALGPDWRHDTRYDFTDHEVNLFGYRPRVWSADGRAVGIAFIAARKPGERHVLMVLLPEDG